MIWDRLRQHRDEPRPRRPVRRMILGCLIVLLCSAGGAAAFVLGQVHSLRDAINQNPAISVPSGTLAGVGWGDPQTLLLVGDDQRSLTGAFKYYSRAVLPHSNEMLLVRIDPSKPYISMMSIPRELYVPINTPAQGTVYTRFNYAYTAGGIPLLVSTIKQVLGVSVNHVMVITFARFQRAVDEMGCVYSTIDRRYYHVNTPGTEQYQEINLQPGYQNMCGKQALQFVSYRHGDTSLVRDARDQSFLLDVKKQYGPTLVDSVSKFEHIFGKAVQTDAGLHSTTGLLNLIGTLISSSSRRVRQVQFQVNLAPNDPAAIACQCVTATPGQIAASVHSFLHGVSAPPKHATAAVARAVHRRGAVARLPLVPTPPGELQQAQSAARHIPFTYEFPRVQDRAGSIIPVYLRNYIIHAPGGTAYPIYDEVFSVGQLGQYYDIQGTTWTSPPLLTSPEQTVQVGGRTYGLYYQGSKLEMVAWAEHGALYWVRNTLNNVMPGGELLAIAEQTTPTGGVAGTLTRHLHLRSAALPVAPVAAKPVNLRELLGGLAALLTLLAVPLLGFLVLRRRRELRNLRAWVEFVEAEEQRLGAQLARMARPVRPAAPAPRPETAAPREPVRA